MKLTSFMIAVAGVALTAGTNLPAKPAAPKKGAESDIATIEARKGVVEMAQGLAKQEQPAPLADDLPVPFNPRGFNAVVHEAPRPPEGQVGPIVRRSGDREVLEAIASRVLPSGTFSLGGERYLQFSKKRLKVGDKLTVTHEGADYTLELTAIDATNFTLRLNREEITRPIKPGK